MLFIKNRQKSVVGNENQSRLKEAYYLETYGDSTTFSTGHLLHADDSNVLMLMAQLRSQLVVCQALVAPHCLAEEYCQLFTGSCGYNPFVGQEIVENTKKIYGLINRMTSIWYTIDEEDKTVTFYIWEEHGQLLEEFLERIARSHQFFNLMGVSSEDRIKECYSMV